MVSDVCYRCLLYGRFRIAGNVRQCRRPQVLKEPVILFVGLHPGKSEVDAGVPFVGPTSEPFVNIVRDLRLWDHSVFTNVIRCMPHLPISDEEMREVASVCCFHVLKDIEAYKPTYVCLLGEVAATAFFKMIKVKRPPMGDLITWHNRYVGWTYHPAAAVRNPNLWKAIRDFLTYLKRRLRGSDNVEIEYKVVEREEEAVEELKYYQQAAAVSCDFEVDCEIPVHPKLRGKSVASKVISAAVSCGERTTVFLGTHLIPLLKDLIISPRPMKVFHNALFELLWCWRLWDSVPPPRSFCDTLIMYYLLDEDRDDADYSLKAMSSFLLGVPSWEDERIKEAKRTGLLKLPPQVLARYNAYDAYYTYRLYEYLLPQIKENDLTFLLFEIINPLECLYALSTARGIRVDIEYLSRESRRRFEELVSNLILEIRQRSGGYIKNPRSWQEKQFYLFNVLGLKVEGGKETSNRKTLEALMVEYPEHREILSLLIEFSRVDKIYSSYISKWDTFVDVDKRIRPEFKFFGTRTGRLSVNDPPFHNFPSDRTPAGMEARRFIIPSENYYFLYSDASQFEVRVMANKSGDENLQQAFYKGYDIYTQIASVIFNKPAEEIDKETERQVAKQMVLGIFYGMSAPGLAKLLHISEDLAASYIAKLREEYPKVFEYMEMVRRLGMERGFVRNWCGRYRRIYAATQGDERALRQLGNFVIQSEASDWWQQTTLYFYRLAYKRLGKESVYVLATVHDSLLAEVRSDVVDEAVKCLRDAMILVSALFDLKVPIDGEYRILVQSLGEKAEKIPLLVTQNWLTEGIEEGRRLMREFGLQPFVKRGV